MLVVDETRALNESQFWRGGNHIHTYILDHIETQKNRTGTFFLLILLVLKQKKQLKN